MAFVLGSRYSCSFFPRLRFSISCPYTRHTSNLIRSPNCVLPPAAVTSCLMSILACHGFARGAFLGHSYGSKYSSSYFSSNTIYSFVTSSDPYKTHFKYKHSKSVLPIFYVQIRTACCGSGELNPFTFADKDFIEHIVLFSH